jgi:hypothetical protein
MSADRWPSWAAEAAGTNEQPAMRHVLLLAVVVVVLVAILGAGQAPASSSRPASIDTPVCAEAARLARHGYATDYARATRAACQRARAAVPAP